MADSRPLLRQGLAKIPQILPLPPPAFFVPHHLFQPKPACPHLHGIALFSRLALEVLLIFLQKVSAVPAVFFSLPFGGSEPGFGCCLCPPHPLGDHQPRDSDERQSVKERASQLPRVARSPILPCFSRRDSVCALLYAKKRLRQARIPALPKISPPAQRARHQDFIPATSR